MVNVIDAEDVQEMSAATVVNVLPKRMYDRIHIEGSISIPLDRLRDGAWKELDEPVIVYCANSGCDASLKAARFLDEQDMEVYDYKAGMEDWAERGLPVDGEVSREEFLEEGY